MSDAAKPASRSRRVPLRPRAAGAIDPLRAPVYLVPPTRPTAAGRVGRVFGYLGMTLLWLLVLAVVVFATVFALPGALGGGEGLAASPMWHRSDTWLAPVVLLLVAAIIGYATVFTWLASLGLVLASATAFVRSLSPSYRNERLTITRRSSNGEAVGPITTAFTGVALSLLPVRMTRWAKVFMIVQFNGWIINGSSFVIGFGWGCLYLFTVGWLLWPASGAGLVVCAVVSIVVAGWLVFEIWRRRRRYPTVMPEALRGTVYELSWPNLAPRPRPRRGVPAARKATPGGR